MSGRHGEGLPDLPLEAGGADLLADDGVGPLEQGDLLGRDLADDADAEAGAGEGLAPDDLVGEAELGAEGAHLVLEQAAEGLDQLELHVLGEAADVVVALDGGGAVAAAGLDDVGVEGALHQVSGRPRCRRRSPRRPRMNSSPMALRFSSGSVMPDEPAEEPVGGVDVDELDALVATERLDDLLALALAHEAVVDEDAGELRADGLVDEGGGDGRVDPAGEGADHAGVADLGPDGLDAALDDGGHRPLGRRSRTPRRASCSRICWPWGVWTTSGWNWTAWMRRSIVSMAATGASGLEAVTVKPSGARVMESRWLIHTCWWSGWPPPNTTASGWVTSRGVRPYSARPVLADQAAELQGDELGAVADAQDRHAEVVDAGVDRGRPVDVDRRRTAAEDDAGGGPGGVLLGRQGGGDDLAVDVGLADPPGDQLGVLGPEVDDQDGASSAAGWGRSAGRVSSGGATTEPYSPSAPVSEADDGPPGGPRGPPPRVPGGAPRSGSALWVTATDAR